MRFRLFALLLVVVAWSCSAAEPSTTVNISAATSAPPSPPGDVSTAGGTTTPAPLATSTVPPSTTAAPSITAPTPTTAPPAAGTPALPGGDPVYITFGSLGAFRVEGGGTPSALLDDPVLWAADDGRGGLLFVTEPGTLRHLPAGAGEAATIATDVSPGYVAWVEGKPALVMYQANADCGRWDVVLLDVGSGARQVFASCVPFEASGLIPRSMGGGLAVTTEGLSGVEEVPRMRLVFRTVSADVIDMAHNPWPEPCPACRIDALLSPDGSVLAVAENLPEPKDLGVSDWAAFEALDPTERWLRWESYLPASTVRMRTISLATGATMWSGDNGVGGLIDFDGRYLVYRFGGMGHHAQFPYNTHLYDTWDGNTVDVVWGPGEYLGHDQQEIDLVPVATG